MDEADRILNMDFEQEVSKFLQRATSVLALQSLY